MDLKLKFTVHDAITARLRELPKKLRNRLQKEGMDEAGTILVREMAAGAPISTDSRLTPGMLKKSVGKKTKTYRGKVVVLIVGVQKGLKWSKIKGTNMQRRKATRAARFIGKSSYSKSGYQIPSQYAHLAGKRRRATFGKDAARKAKGVANTVLEGKLRQALAER